MLTLKKVKEMVKAPVHTKRVPSPKVLLEEGRIFLRKEFEHGSHLTLYHNGYVWFSAGKRNTVFHIHRYSWHSPEKKRPHIGHYGHLRKAYLESYRPDLYAALTASERLYEHCAEIEDAARSRLDIIIPRLAASVGATEALKAQDPMKWVGLMNACKAQAEEIVKFELIYD